VKDPVEDAIIRKYRDNKERKWEEKNETRFYVLR
jgi:hypothetical protein